MRAAYDNQFPQDDRVELGCLRARDYIRALTTNHARAALEAMLAEARKEGMLRAAEIADEAADGDQKEGLVQMAARGRYIAIAARSEAAAIRAETDKRGKSDGFFAPPFGGQVNPPHYLAVSVEYLNPTG
jgi:hypothetical protein